MRRHRAHNQIVILRHNVLHIPTTEREAEAEEDVEAGVAEEALEAEGEEAEVCLQPKPSFPSHLVACCW